MKNVLLLILCAASLMAGDTKGLTKLKSELDIRRGIMQPISSESSVFICKSPSKEIKTAMMAVFKQQLNTDIGQTLNITLKDAESIADSYIKGAKNMQCPVGFKLASPCGPCDGGTDYKIVH